MRDFVTTIFYGVILPETAVKMLEEKYKDEDQEGIFIFMEKIEQENNDEGWHLKLYYFRKKHGLFPEQSSISTKNPEWWIHTEGQ